MILGRAGELSQLRKAWDQANQGVPQLAVIWGRRRVGKTYLLTHFAQGKRAVYFTATRQDSEDRQLRRYAERMRDQLGESDRELVPDTFPDWEAALRFTVRLAHDSPLLVVIDEAPRLTASRSDFADLVSAVWENHVHGQPLMLVLTGSAVAVMEEMLGPHGGLHRRPTLERRIDPFPLVEAREFQPSLPAADFLHAYAACGGYPLHLQRWQPDLDVTANLRELAFTPGGLLLRDAPDILSEDLDWRGGYERVLRAMAGGARRRSRIAGRAQQRIDYTLDRLSRAGYVRRVRPVGEVDSADSLYEIVDVYVSYWFTVLRDDADLVEGGQGEAVRRRTEGRWQRHLAWVFESAAREHAQRLVKAGRFPADTVVGRWWQDETVEIDVLGLSGDHPVLVGEARWQATDLTQRDFTELRRKADRLADPANGLTYAFWSRGAASAALAQQPDVHVFGPGDLLE